ncbi:hypothetical protein MCOR07_004135 [Pyricularia oryzae]|uniref:Peptidase M20 dimerisation domain-containing protein n=2 Tax=Pyricularia TaxID=48558 RepID=A0ABQ8N7C5_PYRGI|nr:hypothetical protein MCOR01_000624 [Pyricularia oryzae]KAI6292470.1 hypothetical protein MCOR33_009840 [Pyricularia grisea]KAI6262856.1 hypothetical protein MCOR19_001024 [Pyricularia oryzae]KAI6282755.1 hypothetical protein MCOR26_002714 [Pyricularia oryzae]KAI6289809.1 hypothetical protein MCOR34_010628 [Pyricularia oryzae]
MVRAHFTSRALLALLITAIPISACGEEEHFSPLPRRQSAGNSTGVVGGPTTSSPHLTTVSEHIDSLAEELWPISTEIHENPELGYEEVRAHDLLTTYVASKPGWEVTRSAFGLDTSFVAVFDGGHGAGPVVSFNAEYDALQGLGHGCGHNLIATASVAGALAAAEVMRRESLPGKVVLFGTPAEESLGGKVRMLEAGAFAEHAIDISIMAHPGPGGDAGDAAYTFAMATDRFDVEYHGQPAHAAASPWLGVNAQDAIALAYAALGLMRQQSRPADRVHGRIATAPGAVNIIPDSAGAVFQIRSDTTENLAPLIERFEKAMEAGALGTGATMNLTMRPYGYSDMLNNDVLARHYREWFDGAIPTADEEKLSGPGGSTDQGNVSHDFPALHAFFGIFGDDGAPATASVHSEGFREAAKTRKSFDKALKAAKALAGTAVDVLTVEGLLDEVKEDFEQNNKKDVAQRLARLRRRMIKK